MNNLEAERAAIQSRGESAEQVFSPAAVTEEVQRVYEYFGKKLEKTEAAIEDLETQLDFQWELRNTLTQARAKMADFLWPAENTGIAVEGNDRA